MHSHIKSTLALLVFLLWSPSWSLAHFPWMAPMPDGRLGLFFGEDLNDRTYHLPSSVAEASVHWFDYQAQPKALSMSRQEGDQFVGLVSESVFPSSAVASADITYGIYHGTLLKYHVFHYSGQLPNQCTDLSSDESAQPMFGRIVNAEASLDLYAFAEGKPISGVEVKLLSQHGNSAKSGTTDANGKVSFPKQPTDQPGLHGIWLGVKSDIAGEYQNQDFSSKSEYFTLTFTTSSDAANDAATPLPLPSLPEAITSFGAARIGDCVYVYGGHTGEAHAYSNQAQSDHLYALNLARPEQGWQTLAQGDRLQGLGLVAYQDQLIVVGGFTAQNEAGAEHDLHSQSVVRAYNVQTREWCELPALPEPRSSHDAALIGSRIYVVGGWQLNGSEDSLWHRTAWQLDLADSNPQWTAIAPPPFSRRAVALVAHRNKLFVIGGMNEHGGPTKAVAVYNPETQSWSELAELLGEKPMAGFGAAAFSLHNELIVTTLEGDLLKYDDQVDRWHRLGKTGSARFFHRLVAGTSSDLIAIGGANMEEGKFWHLEPINLR